MGRLARIGADNLARQRKVTWMARSLLFGRKVPRLGKIERFILSWAYAQHWPVAHERPAQIDPENWTTGNWARLMTVNAMAAYARDVLLLDVPMRNRGKRFGVRSFQMHFLCGESPEAKLESRAVANRLSRAFSKALRNLETKELVYVSHFPHASDQRTAFRMSRSGFALTALGNEVARRVSGLTSP